MQMEINFACLSFLRSSEWCCVCSFCSIQTSVSKIQVRLHEFLANTANLHFQEWHNEQAALCAGVMQILARYIVLRPCVLGILMAMPRHLIIDFRLRINHLFNWKLDGWLAVSCFHVPRSTSSHVCSVAYKTQTFWCSGVFLMHINMILLGFFRCHAPYQFLSLIFSRNKHF